MKFSDTFNKSAFSRPIEDENAIDKPAPKRTASYEASGASLSGSPRITEESYGYGRSFMANESPEEARYYTGVAADGEFGEFQDKLRRGKIKICGSCGGTMNKRTRMILSPLAGAVLIALGMAFMVGYGLATNFYQPPWFIKFALPAGYYVGSIFIGVGILFYFIREKVWICQKCRDIRKR